MDKQKDDEVSGARMPRTLLEKLGDLQRLSRYGVTIVLDPHLLEGYGTVSEWLDSFTVVDPSLAEGLIGHENAVRVSLGTNWTTYGHTLEEAVNSALRHLYSDPLLGVDASPATTGMGDNSRRDNK